MKVIQTKALLKVAIDPQRNRPTIQFYNNIILTNTKVFVSEKSKFTLEDWNPSQERPWGLAYEYLAGVCRQEKETGGYFEIRIKTGTVAIYEGELTIMNALIEIGKFHPFSISDKRGL